MSRATHDIADPSVSFQHGRNNLQRSSTDEDYKGKRIVQIDRRMPVRAIPIHAKKYNAVMCSHPPAMSVFLLDVVSVNLLVNRKFPPLSIVLLLSRLSLPSISSTTAKYENSCSLDTIT